MTTFQTLMGRQNNFDFLRFVLASVVVIAHAFKLIGGQESKLYFTLTGHTNPAILAVNGFFVISGFLITRSWLASASPGEYLRKRLLRIIPGYLGVLLFCTLLVGPLSTHDFSSYRQSPWALIMATAQLRVPNVPGMFSHNPIPDVNESLWTLQYELLCYVALMLLGLAGLLRHPVLVLGIFGMAYGCHILSLVLPDSFSREEIFLLGSAEMGVRFATYFLAGSVAYLYRERIQLSRRGILAAFAILAATATALGNLLLPASFLFGALLVIHTFIGRSRMAPGRAVRLAGTGILLVGCPVAAVLSRAEISAYHLFWISMPVAGSYLLLGAAFARTPRLHRFATAVGGDLSYGIYLYHYPVLQLLVQHIGPSLNVGTLFLPAYAITGILACLSWHLIEQPFLKLKARRLPVTEARETLTFGYRPTDW